MSKIEKGKLLWHLIKSLRRGSDTSRSLPYDISDKRIFSLLQENKSALKKSESEHDKLLDIREELKNVYGYEEEISKYERRRYNGVLGRKSLSQDQRYTSLKENISKNPLEILEDKEIVLNQRA